MSRLVAFLSLLMNGCADDVPFNAEPPELQLVWDASPDEIVGYNLYRSLASGGPYERVNQKTIMDRVYTDVSVLAERKYYYVVRAEGQDGIESINSNQVSVELIEDEWGDLSLPQVTLPPPVTRVAENTIALYVFKEKVGDTIRDTSGVGAPLDLKISNTSMVARDEGSLTIIGAPQIASPAAALKLNTAIPKTGEITIEVWVSPANKTQNDAARIVSVSASTSLRNFTIGQGISGTSPGTQYVARLRTTTTGENGLNPMLSTPDGSVATRPTQIVYTRRSNGEATIYLDAKISTKGTIGGSLSNWNGSYRLLLGNELTENRPWKGTYYLLAIYDRALTGTEVLRNYHAGF